MKFISSRVILSTFFITSTICFAQEQSDKREIALYPPNDPCRDVLYVDSCFPMATYRGKVVKVLDGQTVVIILKKEIPLGGEFQGLVILLKAKKVRLRLAAISAPTLKEKYGKESKQNLERLLLNHIVKVRAYCSHVDGIVKVRAYCSHVDGYGKEGWRAAVEYEALDAGMEQINSGLARFDGSTGGVQEYQRCHYELAEKKAKADGKGIWQREAK